MGVVTQ